MRTYQVSCQGKVRYAGTNALAAQAKKDLLEAAGLGPRSTEASIKEIDVPTSKPELIEFLNELSAKADPKEAPDGP